MPAAGGFPVVLLLATRAVPAGTPVIAQHNTSTEVRGAGGATVVQGAESPSAAAVSTCFKVDEGDRPSDAELAAFYAHLERVRGGLVTDCHNVQSDGVSHFGTGGVALLDTSGKASRCYRLAASEDRRRRGGAADSRERDESASEGLRRHGD